jgi:hypothetical protein
MGIFLPLGTVFNYFLSGRVLRGTLTMTLMIALVMRTIEAASPP